jgi:glycosyltransferase involved in cell wall biosynthesis
MLTVAIFFSLIVLTCAVFQNHCTAGLLRTFENDMQATPATGTSHPQGLFEPQAVVILCLRGADPHLGDCLSGLLAQNYKNWDLRIVVDHADDPAVEVVESILGRESQPNVTVRVLETRYETCSLKLSALSQELAMLGENCEAVVLVDADVMTYPDWLKDMLKPLQHKDVGATTGIRWFAPPDKSPGAIMRYVWNLGALGQMHRFGIAWGGSLAMKAEFVRSAELSKQWSQMAFEDTALLTSLTRDNLQLQFVPQAVLVNSESIGGVDCMKFIRRQILNAKLYHPAWKSIFSFGFLSAAGTAGSLIVLFGALLTLNWPALAALAGMLGIACLTSALSAIRLQSSVHQQLATRSNRRLGSALLKSTIYVIPSQLFYGFVLLAVLKQKTVDWRGIRYHIESAPGVCRIQMKEYRPIASAADPLSSIV